MTLYQVSTRELGDYYIVADNLNAAEAKLKNLFDRSDYGFRTQREIASITIITKEMTNYPKDKPNFDKEARLILETSCPEYKQPAKEGTTAS